MEQRLAAPRAERPQAGPARHRVRSAEKVGGATGAGRTSGGTSGGMGADGGAGCTGHEEARQLLAAYTRAVQRLDGQFQAAAERLARPVGLTAAWWQVLDTVRERPRTVAEVARATGVTRQSVQRVADLLVARGLAVFRPNPAHRRAKLLAPTPEGHTALSGAEPRRAAFAKAFATELATALGGEQEPAVTLRALDRLSRALDRLGSAQAGERAEDTGS